MEPVRRCGMLVRALLPLMVLSALSPAVAQPEQPTPEGIDEQLRRQVTEIRERLELSPEQEKQIEPILTENAKQLREMRARYAELERNRENMAAARDEVRALRKKMNEQLAEILSAEQMEEYGKIQDERRRERNRRMGRAGRGG